MCVLHDDILIRCIITDTCAVLLILQAMVFLRIAKGYARLGIVTQTLAYAKSELLHFTLIFFFILWIYGNSHSLEIRQVSITKTSTLQERFRTALR